MKIRKSQKLLLLVVFLLLITVTFFIYRTHRSSSLLSSDKYGFKYLEPTRLPSGVKIVGKRISVTSEAGKVYGVQAEINLRPVDWVYSIRESKSDGSTPVAITQNYDQNSVKPSCSQENTSKNSYRLCHWIDYGTIQVYEVRFAQGSTDVNAQIPLETKDHLSVSSLNSFVDSFAPANPPIEVISGI